MDISNIATQLGALFGVQPSTLLLFIFIVSTGARVVARRIPDNATGFWAFVRQTCAILGAEVSSKLTADVSTKDVLKAASTTPSIAAKIDAANSTDEAKD